MQLGFAVSLRVPVAFTTRMPLLFRFFYENAAFSVLPVCRSAMLFFAAAHKESRFHEILMEAFNVVFLVFNSSFRTERLHSIHPLPPSLSPVPRFTILLIENVRLHVERSHSCANTVLTIFLYISMIAFALMWKIEIN